MKNKMENQILIKGQDLRNSTPSEYVIFFDGQELPTTKGGAINSKGGIVLTALVPALGFRVEHRSNDAHGYKGWSKGNDKNDLSMEIKSRLEYKYANK